MLPSRTGSNSGSIDRCFSRRGLGGHLPAIHGALRPGGYLALLGRNPEARAWEQWTRAATFERFDSPNGPMGGTTAGELLLSRQNYVNARIELGID